MLKGDIWQWVTVELSDSDRSELSNVFAYPNIPNYKKVLA